MYMHVYTHTPMILFTGMRKLCLAKIRLHLDLTPYLYLNYHSHP